MSLSSKIKQLSRAASVLGEIHSAPDAEVYKDAHRFFDETDRAVWAEYKVYVEAAHALKNRFPNDRRLASIIDEFEDANVKAGMARGELVSYLYQKTRWG